VVTAFEAEQATAAALPASDVWSFGIIAFEMLTAEPTFEPFASLADVRDRITGRAAMPWEGESAAELLPQLRVFRETILACLRRDPASRPPIGAVVRAFERLFQATSALGAAEVEGAPVLPMPPASMREPTGAGTAVDVHPDSRLQRALKADRHLWGSL
jgi:serine/threonine protein kinase